MLILDTMSPKAIPTSRNRSTVDKAVARLACSVLLRAAKDYRDHPIYDDRQKSARELIAEFIRGNTNTKIWHRLGDFHGDKMERLLEFAESDIEFHLECVLRSQNKSIEEELADVEDHLLEMTDGD